MVFNMDKQNKVKKNHDVKLSLLNVLTLSSLLLVYVDGNQMDPHVYPDAGPFFEGWYMRIIDTSKSRSFGWLFGRVLPSKNTMSDPCENKDSTIFYSTQACDQLKKHLMNETTTESLPLVYSSLLINPGPDTKLQAVTGFFKPNEYSITKTGKPVTTNPDDKSPPSFEGHIGNNVTFVVRPHGTNFSITVGNSVLQGSTASPVSWGPNGKGPEGWIEYLPLPIQWFVYSLRSNVVQYKYINKETGQVLSGPASKDLPVVAHMEKNWGKAFPNAWVWAEGVDPSSNVSFSISSGLVTFGGIDIKAELAGYRNPSKGISCSFSPVNSIHTLMQDGCSGTASLTVEGLGCKVVFELSATPASFSDCLFTPQVDGFRKGCVESYTAVANITVYQRDFLSMKLTDQQVIKLAALEFGEQYMCNGKCPK